MPNIRWCAAVMGYDDGGRLTGLMREAHGGQLPCQTGQRCPLEPRGETLDEDERRIA